MDLRISRRKLDDLRLMASLALLLILGFMLAPRETDAQPGGDANAIVGEPAGTSWAVPSAAAAEPAVEPAAASDQAAAAVPPPPTVAPSPSTPEPTSQPTPDPTITPEPTPTVTTDGFRAEVETCRSISGPSCEGPIDEVAAGTFVALILIENSRTGDVVEARLVGDETTIGGGPVSLAGGDGYYYTTFSVAGLSPGTYTVVATRNGEEVDRTEITVGGD